MSHLSPFKQSFLGALAALLVFAVVFVAGAVLAQEYDPVKDINADGRIDAIDIQQVASSWNTAGSPRGTLQVFSSSTTTTGNPAAVVGASSRRGMTLICHIDDPDAHFCTAHEIENALLTTGVDFSGLAATSWLDHMDLRTIYESYGGDLYLSSWANAVNAPRNCYGWHDTAAGYYGITIIEGGQYLTNGALCTSELPVACCR